MSKPYLKWAGGKSSLSEELLIRFPADYDRYIEPFLGSAAMYFACCPPADDLFSKTVPALLNDLNSILIGTHECVSQDCEKVKKLVDAAQKVFDDAEDKKSHYYACRKEFNSLMKDMQYEKSYILAASFIFINKTCFNGLWRVNSKGVFNVPWNQSEKVKICSSSINECSRMLSQAELFNMPFDEFIEQNVREGDFVFLDPPYIPMSETAAFTSYTSDGWSNEDDSRLVEMLNLIHERKAKFLMTNSGSPLVRELFGQWDIDTIRAHRFIRAQGKDESREKVNETVIRNY